METKTSVKKRSFDLIRISEEEGLVLRTLLNINRVGVVEKLQADELYWNEELTLEEATSMGVGICDMIMAMVDGED